MQDRPDPAMRPEDFWEDFYQTRRTSASGKPSMILVRYAEDLPPGAALDLGCSRGDDAIWLAARGWRATGLDISATAIERAKRRAQEAGVGDRVRFARHDLAQGLPEERFDLVTALYFQSPVELPRANILRSAASAVASGGRLLIVAHTSPPPWSNAPSDTRMPTVAEELEALSLDAAGWAVRVAETLERQATGPDGQTAILSDTVVFAERNESASR